MALDPLEHALDPRLPCVVHAGEPPTPSIINPCDTLLYMGALSRWLHERRACVLRCSLAEPSATCTISNCQGPAHNCMQRSSAAECECGMHIYTAWYSALSIACYPQACIGWLVATAGWLCRGPLASRQRMHLPGMCVGGGAYSGSTVGASESACTPESSASLLLDAGMCSDIWLGKQFVQLLWHALRRLVANTLFQLAAPPRFCAPSAVSQPAVAVT
jgi:hypothetical protein